VSEFGNNVLRPYSSDRGELMRLTRYREERGRRGWEK